MMLAALLLSIPTGDAWIVGVIVGKSFDAEAVHAYLKSGNLAGAVADRIPEVAKRIGVCKPDECMAYEVDQIYGFLWVMWHRFNKGCDP